MTLTQSIALNWSGDGSAGINGSASASGDGVISNDVGLINGSKVVTVGIRSAGLGLLYLKATVAATLTFRDAGGTSVGAVTLVANTPYMWFNGLGTIPISADVATINCAATAEGTCYIRGIQDSTPATATAALTGTITSAVESDIVGGGKTIILTLTGATWVPSGAAFNAQRQAILNGLDSAQSEAAGWDAQLPSVPVTAVARTSDTVVTITLPALGSYSVTADETVTATIPTPATSADQAIVASPTFTITANS